MTHARPMEPGSSGPRPGVSARRRPTLADRLHPQGNSYTLLRLVAALTVVAAHAMTLGVGPEAPGPMASWTPFDAGQHAVNLFFVLSGIMVFASIERSASLVDFLLRRALRIYPALLVCLLLVAGVVGPLLTQAPLADYATAPQTWTFVPKMLLVPSEQHTLPGLFATLPHALSVNSPLWTIKYEAFLYVVLGGLWVTGLLGGPRRRALCIAALLAPFPLLSAVPGLAALVAETSTSLVHLTRFAFCFGLGMLAYVARDRLVLCGRTAAALLAATVALSLLAPHDGPYELSLLAPLWMIALGFGALVLGAGPMGRAGAFARRSDLSYGVYIYGWIVGQVLLSLVPDLGAPALIAWSVPLSLALGSLSWTLVEKPALAFKPGAGLPARLPGRAGTRRRRDVPAT